jgi:hypothetical protein
MRHETALRRLDELDSGEEPGFALAIHLASCPSCARQAKLVAKAISAYRFEGPADRAPGAAEGGATEERIMASVRLVSPPRQDFAIFDWLFPAMVILFSLCLLPLASSLGFIESLLGEGGALSLALVLGIAFTIYCAFFIATHIQELELFLEKRGVVIR